MIDQSFHRLLSYIEKENFKGYDPYDTLNSWVPFHWLGQWGPVIATQIQKRNPINVRPFIGINKEINPKAFGLFLKAYSLLYRQYGKKEYLEKADYFYKYLKEHPSEGYSGLCWGYNFPWASPGEFVHKYTPTAVATGFVVQGLYEYYLIARKEEVKEVISSACNFLVNDLKHTQFDDGICISYTPLWPDLCFNASLLAAEALAINAKINQIETHRELSLKAMKWVVSHQAPNGKWNYSINRKTGKQREQIDFHQGYVLMSVRSIVDLIEPKDKETYNIAIDRGLDFYFKHQFFKEGVSKWRLPRVWPVDIHNQSQGVITFAFLGKGNSQYSDFAKKILEWTITNMQHPRKGYFYYKKYKYLTHKTPYMRWGQAWMLMAFTIFLNSKEAQNA